MRNASRLLSRLLCLLVIGICANTMRAQDSAPQPSEPATSSPTKNTEQPTAASDTGPLGDYVPCIFSDDDELSMRARPPAVKPQAPMNPAAAELLFDKVNSAIQNELSTFDLKPEFAAKFQAYYSSKITPAALFNMTPDAAIAKIQSVLSLAIADARSSGTYVRDPASTVSPQQVQDAKNRVANQLASDIKQALQQLHSDKAKAKRRPTIDEALDAASESIKKTAANLKLSDSYRDDVIARFRSETVYDLNRNSYYSFTYTLENNAALAAQRASEYPFAALPQSATTTVQNNLAKELFGVVSDATKQAGTPPPAKQFQPPSDVSCSTAVLSWREAHDIFGRRVANTFVGIQVTMRNLNTKNEFLIHDIQVAVDTGMTSDNFGRFQAGRDKLLVRAVAQRGQASDPRNVALNVLQTVGAIAGASSVSAGTVEFRDAVAVFQSAFLPGFANIFPDHTVEQLNHINDLVFSASNTSKVVVPVQGSVPLVTFISEKPIEELPFAWCGRELPGRFHKKKRQSCDFNGGSHDPGYPYEAFKKEQPWDSLKYKDWSAAALRMLQMHTFVVVGGVHIQQVITQPRLTNLACATLSSGQVDISQTKDGMVSCSAAGTGLNLVSAASLVKGTSSVSGKVQPATDGNSAAITFNPTDLCDKQGAYSLTLTYKSDTQKNPTDLDSGESVLLGKQPTIASVSFADKTLTLGGACLDEVESVALAPQVGDATVKGDAPIPDQSGKNTSATSQFVIQTATDKSGLVPGASYFLTYSSKVQPSLEIKKEALTVKIPQADNSASAPNRASQKQTPATSRKVRTPKQALPPKQP